MSGFVDSLEMYEEIGRVHSQRYGEELHFSQYPVTEEIDIFDSPEGLCGVLEYQQEQNQIKAVVHITDDQKRSEIGGYLDFLLRYDWEESLV